jgi:thioredoxin reductase (NADPH)
VGGTELISRGRRQARRYGAKFVNDMVIGGQKKVGAFVIQGEKHRYTCKRLLVATGIFHIPPDIPGIKPCLGHSMFFCKDCDGYRVQGKTIAVYGYTNETVDYALGMLPYSSCVMIVTDGRVPRWDEMHSQFAREYKIPISEQPIVNVRRNRQQIVSLQFDDSTEVLADALFTTRGDIYFSKLAKDLGAAVNDEGEVVVDVRMRTTVEGLYAAGCVTPANCQMIIAAGQGAAAAQAINRSLFDESLTTHSLRIHRDRQLRNKKTRPSFRARR